MSLLYINKIIKEETEKSAKYHYNNGFKTGLVVGFGISALITCIYLIFV
jgi:hypothetical protein